MAARGSGSNEAMGGPSRAGQTQERWDALVISDACCPKEGGHDREGGAGGGDGVGGPHLEDEAVSKAGVSLQLGITKDCCMQVLRTWARGRA